MLVEDRYNEINRKIEDLDYLIKTLEEQQSQLMKTKGKLIETLMEVLNRRNERGYEFESKLHSDMLWGQFELD